MIIGLGMSSYPCVLFGYHQNRQPVFQAEFDPPPSPQGTRFRRLRLILSLGRLVYQDHSASRPSCRDLEQKAEGRLWADGHNTLLHNFVNVDGVKRRYLESAKLGLIVACGDRSDRS